ncbi:MAG: trypsin-like peptidase domain-containing protein [Myxococcales bacterium]|nr:trypsin-like peptidase domain-containing protein [Myxococcales bacterium]
MNDVSRAPADTWRQSLERVARAVVSVRIDAPRPFDTDWNESAQATAFVVDAEAGLLLTNRHVVRPGPAVAEAVFLNHEEAPLRPVYRDPVHDFGFFRFDPGALRFMEPVGLRLAPEKAQIGTEIRVVGNDAGEKLSILAGTIARLDRPVPNYGLRRYNDFNTSYIQAASSTSGGSSGSPVVDIEGDVVALNAGSRTQAASSFFLPLGRVVRALKRIREGLPVTRGTLTTTFGFRAYDELRRLGLTPATEEAMRAAFPASTSLLVVEKILPGGPTDGALELGDVLLSVGGKPVHDFAALEAILDARVGETLAIEVERGGRKVEAETTVRDLHAITPSSFLELGGAVVHDLSYQIARQFEVPLRGVYVASTGYIFASLGIDRGAVIQAVGGRPTPDLASLEAIFTELPHGTRTSLRYFDVEAPLRERVAVITVDRCFFPMTRRTRDDDSGIWLASPAPPPPPPPPVTPLSTTLPLVDDPRAQALAASLVTVEATVPHKIDGVHASNFRGSGLIVDHERGLVITDRSTVPAALADVRLTFAGAVEVDARIAFLHPFHNYAILAYDPAELGDTPLRAATLGDAPPRPGEPVWVVGLRRDQKVFAQRNEVATVSALDLPLPRPPRYRASNLDKIALNHSVRSSLGGVLTDDEGAVHALWATFAYQNQKDHKTVELGLSVRLWRGVVDALRRGEAPTAWDPGIELRYLPLASARNHGLGEAWAHRLEAADPRRRQVLIVERVAGGDDRWRSGDILLELDGAIVNDLDALDAALGPTMRARVLRDREVVEIEVGATPVSGRGTERVLHWAGALIQEVPRSVRVQRGLAESGVYVSLYWYGSPASRSRLRAARLITAVDGRPVASLDEFLAQVAGRCSGDALRLSTLDIDGKNDLITIRLDLEYFPTFELRREGAGWRRIDDPPCPKRQD